MHGCHFSFRFLARLLTLHGSARPSRCLGRCGRIRLKRASCHWECSEAAAEFPAKSVFSLGMARVESCKSTLSNIKTPCGIALIQLRKVIVNLPHLPQAHQNHLGSGTKGIDYPAHSSSGLSVANVVVMEGELRLWMTSRVKWTFVGACSGGCAGGSADANGSASAIVKASRYGAAHDHRDWH